MGFPEVYNLRYGASGNPREGVYLPSSEKSLNIGVPAERGCSYNYFCGSYDPFWIVRTAVESIPLSPPGGGDYALVGAS